MLFKFRVLALPLYIDDSTSFWVYYKILRGAISLPVVKTRILKIIFIYNLKFFIKEISI